MAGLYIHIPFCLKKCPYCDFYSLPYDEALVDEYISSLLKELSLYRISEPIETVYFGGGTPSVLKPAQIERIINRIVSLYKLTSKPEVSLEANPETLNRKVLEGFLSSGINRLSLGIQSLQDHELKAIGRIHDPRKALQALSEAKEVFENVSADIMYGLPGQSPETLKDTLMKLLSFSPTHISAYELTIHEHTEFHRLKTSSLLVLPEEDVIEDMYFLVLNTLKEHGYEHYEVSNYALEGFKCRHNLNYWRMGNYIGIGPSSHSYYNGLRWENISDLKGYINALKEGHLPIASSRTLTDRDIRIERVMLGLRTSDGVERQLILCPEDKLKALQKEGLVEVTQERLKLTDRGMLLSNHLIVELLEGLW